MKTENIYHSFYMALPIDALIKPQGYMSPGLTTFYDHLEARRHELPPHLQHRYSDDGNLAHYRGIATIIEQQLEDPILAYAAFLHGLPISIVQQLFLDDREVLREDEASELIEILEGRQKLASLDGRDPNIQVGDVIASLRSAKSALLFLLERHHHLDPESTFADWTTAFHLHPCDAIPALPEVPLLDTRAVNTTIIEAFCQDVFAKTAEFMGLWQERNTLENVALYYGDLDLFCQLTAFAVASSKPGGLCRDLEQHIRTVLPNHDVCWEWRHIASIARKLEKDVQWLPEYWWQRTIYRYGFVTVICDDKQACYQTLGRLHACFPPRPTELRDSLWQTTPGGYEAIHSLLSLREKADDGMERLIPIRLIPRQANDRRLRRMDKEMYHEILSRQKQADTEESWKTLRVFTPEGEPKDLTLGATVIDFAYTINHSFVARLQGATVNRTPVDLLYELQQGDIVWLDISETPVPLPPAWREHVPSQTLKKITKQFRRYYRPALWEAGRRWVCEKLIARGVQDLPDDRVLDAFIEDAAQHLTQQRVGPQPKSAKIGELPLHKWWLQQIGLLTAKHLGTDLPYDLKITEGTALRLVAATVRIMEQVRLNLMYEWDVPEEVHRELNQIITCEICNPNLRTALQGTLHDEGVLKLHRIGAACGDQGFPVTLHRNAPPPQYFLIEVVYRTGITTDVFAVFKELGMEIANHVGRRLGPSWGVFRVKVDYVDQHRLVQCLEKLKAIHGVVNVFGPDEDPPPHLEKPLPPRTLFETPDYAYPAPYVCGNPIEDASLFYGMEQEKADLFECFGRIRTQSRGVSVWLYGPKRTGKSSLSMQFLQELEQRRHRKCITFYYEATRGKPWSVQQHSIARGLVRTAIDRFQISLPDALGQESLGDTVDRLQRVCQSPVVLIIDEAPGLFHESEKAGEVDVLRGFYDQFMGQANRMIVWVGPEASVRKLDTALQEMLGKADAIKIKGLSKQEIKALLIAKKLAPKYDIRIPDTLVNAIYRDTNGNPFWVSHLGKAMWNQAYGSRKDEVIRYGREHFDRARLTLFQLGTPFDRSLRDEDASAYDQKVIPHILRFLAETTSTATPPTAPLSLDDLQHQLMQCHLGLAREDLEKRLQRLEALGSVRLSDHEKRRWIIAAPILADYIHYTTS